MKDYIAIAIIIIVNVAPMLLGLHMVSWILRNLTPQTEQTKEGLLRLDKLTGVATRFCGRLGVLFVAGGLFIMAADYLHSQNHEDQSDAATRVTQCMRDGACEAS